MFDILFDILIYFCYISIWMYIGINVFYIYTTK